MPIKGLTDRQLAFPEIGRIRKGAPKGENRPGKDLTYFRVEFDEQETGAIEVFSRAYGPEPTEINVILPFDEIDRCWDAWYEAYTAGRMVGRSDGEHFTYLVDVKTGENLVLNSEPKTPHREVVGHYGQKNEAIRMRPVGRLRVMIPELARAAYLTVLTTSIHDIANISAQLEAFKRVNGGRIAGIPLVLRRRPKKISVPKPDGSRMRLAKWMLSIEADPTWVKALLLDVKRSALPGNGLALLPEQTEQDDEIVTVEAVEYDDDWDAETFDSNMDDEPISVPAFSNPLNMDISDIRNDPEPAPAQAKLKSLSLAEQLVEDNVFENTFSAVKVLNKLPPEIRGDRNKAELVCKVYRGIRDAGQNDVDAAIDQALEEYKLVK